MKNRLRRVSKSQLHKSLVWKQSKRMQTLLGVAGPMINRDMTPRCIIHLAVYPPSITMSEPVV